MFVPQKCDRLIISFSVKSVIILLHKFNLVVPKFNLKGELEGLIMNKKIIFYMISIHFVVCQWFTSLDGRYYKVVVPILDFDLLINGEK